MVSGLLLSPPAAGRARGIDFPAGAWTLPGRAARGRCSCRLWMELVVGDDLVDLPRVDRQPERGELDVGRSNVAVGRGGVGGIFGIPLDHGDAGGRLAVGQEVATPVAGCPLERRNELAD